MTTTGFAVRDMRPDDWPSVHQIYADGIATGSATFESEPPEWVAFDAGRLAAGRLVAVDRDAGDVLGWTALSPTSSRAVYRGVVEHSIYVSEAARGHGAGRALLMAMLDAADAAGLWTIQSSVFGENTASLALHHAVGFRTVGVRERIGRMTYGPHAGEWRDTVLIERRSPSI